MPASEDALAGRTAEGDFPSAQQCPLTPVVLLAGSYECFQADHSVESKAAGTPRPFAVSRFVGLWTFDDAGKVSRLRHYTDTAKQIAAFAG